MLGGKEVLHGQGRTEEHAARREEEAQRDVVGALAKSGCEVAIIVTLQVRLGSVTCMATI